MQHIPFFARNRQLRNEVSDSGIDFYRSWLGNEPQPRSNQYHPLTALRHAIIGRILHLQSFLIDEIAKLF